MSMNDDCKVPRRYHIALGTWDRVMKEVDDFLFRGYELAGNLVVLAHSDENGDYVLYYQPMIKPDNP